MNRKEALQQEHSVRTGKTRLESALPPRVPIRCGHGGMVLLVVLLLVVVGLVGWFIYGGHLP